MNIALYGPGVPSNTGAIGRARAATSTVLHPIRPYGFFLEDKYLKRTGTDYWQKLSLCEYDDYAAFLAQRPELDSEQKKTSRKLWLVVTRAEQAYADVNFGPDNYIMFDKESARISEEILVKHREVRIHIPMWGDIRSLNLSSAVIVIPYEALRQQDFARLEKQDALHCLHWETGTKYQVLCKQTIKVKGNSYLESDEYTG